MLGFAMHFLIVIVPMLQENTVKLREIMPTSSHEYDPLNSARNRSIVQTLTNVNSSSSCELVNSRTELSDPEMTCCGNDAPILFRYCSNGLECSLTETGSTTAMPESIGDGDLCRLETFGRRSTVVGGGGDGLVLDRRVCDIVRGIIDRKVLNVLRCDMTCDVRMTDGVRTKHASVEEPDGGRGNSELSRGEVAELGILPMDLAKPRNDGTVNRQRASACKHSVQKYQ